MKRPQRLPNPIKSCELILEIAQLPVSELDIWVWDACFSLLRVSSAGALVTTTSTRHLHRLPFVQKVRQILDCQSPLVWLFPGSLERGRRPDSDCEAGLLRLGHGMHRPRGQSEVCGGGKLSRPRTSIPAQGTRSAFPRVVSSSAFQCCLGLVRLGITVEPKARKTFNKLEGIGASMPPPHFHRGSVALGGLSAGVCRDPGWLLCSVSSSHGSRVAGTTAWCRRLECGRTDRQATGGGGWISDDERRCRGRRTSAIVRISR